jgi:hypothetical protein
MTSGASEVRVYIYRKFLWNFKIDVNHFPPFLGPIEMAQKFGAAFSGISAYLIQPTIGC